MIPSSGLHRTVKTKSPIVDPVLASQRNDPIASASGTIRTRAGVWRTGTVRKRHPSPAWSRYARLTRCRCASLGSASTFAPGLNATVPPWPLTTGANFALCRSGQASTFRFRDEKVRFSTRTLVAAGDAVPIRSAALVQNAKATRGISPSFVDIRRHFVSRPVVRSGRRPLRNLGEGSVCVRSDGRSLARGRAGRPMDFRRAKP
jgi:hypothetical protein